MGIFNKIKKKQEIRPIEEIISSRYRQKYFKECKNIWKNYVPKNGQANNLQGELLREIEKIRYEAQDNGNINWDEDYSYFCDFINDSLSKEDIFTPEEKEEIKLIMTYLKECGMYAQKFYNGEISEDDVDMTRIAYIDDNLYNIICDMVGKLQKMHPLPLPYEKNNNIKR